MFGSVVLWQFQESKKALAEKEVAIEQGKLQAMAGVANGMSSIFEAMGEDNEDFAKLSKVLALAEIAINTGKAIAAGVAQAQSVPYPANLAAIATTVATILANIATALKTVKSAKKIVDRKEPVVWDILEYVMKGRGVTHEMALNVYKKMREYLPEDGVPRTAYQTQIYNKLVALEYFIRDTWGV